MTTEEAQTNAAAIHKMATELLQSFHKNRNLHPPLPIILSMFTQQMTDLATGKSPTSTLESAKVLYLATIIGDYTVDDVAAAYLDIDAANNTTTVAE